MSKKLLAVLVLTLSLSVGARAITLYPNGVIAGGGVTLTGLTSDGWSVIMNNGYGSGAITEADISSWGAAAGAGGYVFVGGIDQQGNVILGATGLASEVLTQTFSDFTAASYSSSNLYWYNENHNNQAGPVGGFGFAPNSSVYLYQADVSDQWDPYRLSWHLNYGGGGWRLGSITNQNFDNTYNRIVLVGHANVPDGGATVALLGVSMLALFGLRRRFAK